MKINKKSFKKYHKKYNKTRKNKRYLQNGGSTIYDAGEISKTDLTYKGLPFFRKVFFYSNPPTENEKRVIKAENKIVKILMKNPHPNIVNYFKVNRDFVDMEELNTTDIHIDEVGEIMKNVKDFLQGLGIAYIDWKIDNIGRGKDGKYKLFDFDASGIFDTDTNEWIIEPVHFWSYENALKRGFTQPKQIDDWSFDYKILHKI
jgi:hypothetical protein